MRAIQRFAVVAALLLGVNASAWGDVTVTLTTTPNGGGYAPRNVVAVWIDAPGGAFVKTIGRWAAARRQHLVAWTTAAGAADADAVSGATRSNHATPLTVTWNLQDKANAVVPDGTYTIRMELADDNSNTPAQNHQGTFTFVKGPQAQLQTALANGGFTNVSIDFKPTANPALCNNGALDPGETCDPLGSCPTSCAASADVCAPNRLVGSAATCTAACVVQTITTCVNGDGCCAAGCDASTDSDCGGGTGATDNTVSGGCTTSGNGGLLVFVAFGAVLLLARKRR
jgi:hypothetical protein